MKDITLNNESLNLNAFFYCGVIYLFKHLIKLWFNLRSSQLDVAVTLGTFQSTKFSGNYETGVNGRKISLKVPLRPKINSTFSCFFESNN